MFKLNKDILYLIFEKSQDDKNTLHSCLLVNKTWCEIIIPILWKNPWKHLKKRTEELLLNVIFSHLSDESDIYFLTKSYQKPLFNYVSLCRHLNLDKIQKIIYNVYPNSETSIINIINNEIIKLFINEDANFTHLYIPREFNYFIPGAKRCFSNLEFLYCNARISDNVLVWLTEICQSVKELELLIELADNNCGIVRLIESSKKLYNISFQRSYYYGVVDDENAESFFKILDNSLENLSLPFLQILNARGLPVKSLGRLIENTSGYLTEIKIDFISYDNNVNKRIFQGIYKNCPNLEYLKLLFKHSSSLELENLLINCQRLKGLFLIILEVFDYEDLFKVLTKSSPIGLFKFKFYFPVEPELTSLRSFFDNWKSRNPMYPMLLQTIKLYEIESFDLIEKYKTEGVIEEYFNDYRNFDKRSFEDFEWIHKKFLIYL